jgi:hypothetical protein
MLRPSVHSCATPLPGLHGQLQSHRCVKEGPGTGVCEPLAEPVAHPGTARFTHRPNADAAVVMGHSK